jgi:ankyrin repeat protein
MREIDQELIEAAKENNLPEVSRLLRAGADVSAKDGSDWTPLHWASRYGRIQVVKKLREHGADIEATTTSGRTPLHWACYSGHVAIVKALVSGGANILAANNAGQLPVHEAVDTGQSEVTKCLLQQLYTTTRHLPIHELVEDLTWIGDPTSSGAPTLRNALHYNVLDTDDVVEILEHLVDRNPDSLASCDQGGSLPLHLACRRGASFTIVQSLVNRYGASVKRVTSEGDLPLFLACDMSGPWPSLDTIFLLMKHNPNCDVVYDEV